METFSIPNENQREIERLNAERDKECVLCYEELAPEGFRRLNCTHKLCHECCKEHFGKRQNGRLTKSGKCFTCQQEVSWYYESDPEKEPTKIEGVICNICNLAVANLPVKSTCGCVFDQQCVQNKYKKNGVIENTKCPGCYTEGVELGIVDLDLRRKLLKQENGRYLPQTKRFILPETLSIVKKKMGDKSLFTLLEDRNIPLPSLGQKDYLKEFLKVFQDKNPSYGASKLISVESEVCDLENTMLALSEFGKNNQTLVAEKESSSPFARLALFRALYVLGDEERLKTVARLDFDPPKKFSASTPLSEALRKMYVEYSNRRFRNVCDQYFSFLLELPKPQTLYGRLIVLVLLIQAAELVVSALYKLGNKEGAKSLLNDLGEVVLPCHMNRLNILLQRHNEFRNQVV